MKKTKAIILTALTIALLTGCSSSTVKTSNQNNDTSANSYEYSETKDTTEEKEDDYSQSTEDNYSTQTNVLYLELKDAWSTLKSAGCNMKKVQYLGVNGERISNADDWYVIYQEEENGEIYLYCMYRPEVYGVSLAEAIKTLTEEGYAKEDILYDTNSDPTFGILDKNNWKVVNVSEDSDGKIRLTVERKGYLEGLKRILSKGDSILNSTAGQMVDVAACIFADEEVKAKIDGYREAYEKFCDFKEKYQNKQETYEDYLKMINEARKVVSEIQNHDTSNWSIIEKGYLYKIEIGILNDILNE